MEFITRAAWGAKPAKSRSAFSVVERIYVHHTTGETLAAPEIAQWVRNIQSSHLRQGWADIGYSFLFDDYGRVYEGRGWGAVGAHTPGWNARSHAFSYLGNGDRELPQAAQDALRWLIAESDRRYGVKPIRGHRDAIATHCPGNWLHSHLGIFRGGSVPVPISPPPPVPPTPAPATGDWFEELIMSLPTIDFRNPAEAQARHGGLIDNVQGLLLAARYAPANPGPLDGLAGPGTLKAIKAFQSMKGLEPDGICGPQTWRALVTH